MDPITQSLLGAAAAHAAFSRRLGRAAIAVGLVGGEVIDFDVFLAPLADPALPHALHRHFTHSLAFVPVGGLIAAAPFALVPSLRRRWGAVYGAATLACLTHPLLDNCTSYGTHLLWPFSGARTAWDSMSIIDPVFTLILLAGVLVALVRGAARPAMIALAVALAYVGLGFAQHARAMGAQSALAAERGHEIAPGRGRAMPTLGNLIVWRSVYEAEGRLWADAVRVPPAGAVQVRRGTSIARFTARDIPAHLARDERVRRVFAAAEAFATGFVGRVPAPGGAAFDSEVIALGDVRYSFATEGFAPIWGLAIDPSAPDPLRAIGFGGLRDRAIGGLWDDVARGRGFAPLSAGAAPAQPRP
jgi:inner membrane protein